MRNKKVILYDRVAGLAEVEKMSDWDPVAAIEPPAVEIKLFGKWNPDEIQVSDISLQVSQSRLRGDLH